MLKLLVSKKFKIIIEKTCRKSGSRECGGVLFAENKKENLFEIVEITADIKAGHFAVFVRQLKNTIFYLKYFFKKYGHNYKKYNYIGEWHSHPQFDLIPSNQDNSTMFEIVMDGNVGANFAVLIIVKLQSERLMAQGWAYYPNKIRYDCAVELTE